MNENFRQCFAIQRAKEKHPAMVQRIEQAERHLDRHRFRVRKLSPSGFVVRTNGRRWFRKSEAKTGVAMHVAVGHMVNHLTDRPAAVAVGGVQLSVSKTLDSIPQMFGRLLNGGKPFI